VGIESKTITIKEEFKIHFDFARRRIQVVGHCQAPFKGPSYYEEFKEGEEP
jgi:hypothetical protein